MDTAKIKQAMIEARGALKTASRDTAADLAKPERARVIQRKIELLTEALRELD